MKMVFPNKWYDCVKWICIVVLPACAVCYEALASVWSFPYAQEIPRTILIVQTFLGALLGISSAQYYKAEAVSIADTIEEDMGEG